MAGWLAGEARGGHWRGKYNWRNLLNLRTAARFWQEEKGREGYMQGMGGIGVKKKEGRA